MKISINISVLALLISLGVLGLFSFKTYREQSQEIEFMQMSVIESVVSGGAGLLCYRHQFQKRTI